MLTVLISLLSILHSSGEIHDGNKRPHGFFALSESVTHQEHPRVVDTTGRFIQINRIFIIGNRITRDHIILRELTYKTGDIVFDRDLPGVLELDEKKLMNTR